MSKVTQVVSGGAGLPQPKDLSPLEGVGSKEKGARGSARLRPLTWFSVLRKLRPFWLTARMQGAGTAMWLQLWMKKKEEPNMGKALRRPGVGRGVVSRWAWLTSDSQGPALHGGL